MKTTIGWAAVGSEGITTSIYSECHPYDVRLNIYREPAPGLVRVEIREAKEKKRKAGRKGEK